MKPGDVVQLRSGGPAMTLASFEKGQPLLGQSDGWRVYWTIQGALRTALLPAEALRLIEEPAKGG